MTGHYRNHGLLPKQALRIQRIEVHASEIRHKAFRLSRMPRANVLARDFHVRPNRSLAIRAGAHAIIPDTALR